MDGDHRGGLPRRRHHEVRPVDQVDLAGVELDGWERPSRPRCVEHPGGEAGARWAKRLHPRRKAARDPTAAPPADGECADLQVRPCRERLEDLLTELAYAGPGPFQRGGVEGDLQCHLGVMVSAWRQPRQPADRLAGSSGAAAYPGRGVVPLARYAGVVCGHWEPGHSDRDGAGTVGRRRPGGAVDLGRWGPGSLGTGAPGHWVSACVTVSVMVTVRSVAAR